MRPRRCLAPAALAALLAPACGGGAAEAPGPRTARTTRVGDTTISFSQGEVQPPAPGTSIDVSDLEIRADGADRFVSCPPSGDLGQGWIPPIPEWTPPPLPQGAELPPPDPSAGQPDGTGKLPLTRTEKALEDLRGRFRDCYHFGLVHDPTQDGHVAVVLRLGRDGKVAKTEAYGACELQPEVIRCMREVAAKLRFSAPAPGDETVVLPVAFAPRAGQSRRAPVANDGYTAAAFLAVEALRPKLHACEESARASARNMDAFATFTMEVDARGHVTYIHVDPWGGEQSILSCAAEVVQQVALPPPPGHRATLIARLSFNPRGGR